MSSGSLQRRGYGDAPQRIFEVSQVSPAVRVAKPSNGTLTHSSWPSPPPGGITVAGTIALEVTWPHSPLFDRGDQPVMAIPSASARPEAASVKERSGATLPAASRANAST